jgi:predicted DNA-binding protein
MPTKTIRLEEEQVRALDAAALANETTVSEVVRDAIDKQIDELRADKDFQARLKRAIARNTEALELLAE